LAHPAGLQSKEQMLFTTVAQKPYQGTLPKTGGICFRAAFFRSFLAEQKRTCQYTIMEHKALFIRQFMGAENFRITGRETLRADQYGPIIQKPEDEQLVCHPDAGGNYKPGFLIAIHKIIKEKNISKKWVVF
jgi:hypothetical protein